MLPNRTPCNHSRYARQVSLIRASAAARLARRSARNADFGGLLETFLVAAVVTILVIRTQLWLTNYPQLGGHGLHIAHLLYGGIFMVIAIGMLLTLLGRWPRRPAAIVGGVGFGFFIDELGKFITSDNNYFFEPAAALIYLIFVGLFLLVRALRRDRVLSPIERLSNAIDLVGEAARRPFDQNQKRRALELLRGADEAGPMVEWVRRLVTDLDALPPAEPPRAARWAAALRRRYLGLVERPWFPRLLEWVFALWALGSFLAVVNLALSFAFDWGGAMAGFTRDDLWHLSFVNWASLISSAASAVLVFMGLLRLHRRRRLEAYRMFTYALLVAIFVTRVFAFVESQFGAVFGLAVDLLLLVTVRYMADQERRSARARELEGAPTAVAGVKSTPVAR
jgi:hypothetical protein